MTATIMKDHVERFQEDGWCALEGFLDEREVAALSAEVDRFRRQSLVRNVRTEGDGVTPSSQQANLQ